MSDEIEVTHAACNDALLAHAGHRISLVYYPVEYEYEGDPAHVALECDTCGEEVQGIDITPATEGSK